MSRHFVTTWPRRTTCPRCRRVVLDGIEEGLPYRIDPVPLTLPGELHAQLTGNRTYWQLANHIVRRTTENITAETPGTRPPVYAWHQCQPPDLIHISAQHIPDTQRLITDKYLQTATPDQDTDQGCLITITDVLNGYVTESPDDQEVPF